MTSESETTRKALVDDLRGDVVRAVSDRTGLVIRLEGEAGIGKSTIVSELTTAARAADAGVWSASATEIGAATPLGAVVGLREAGGARLIDTDRLTVATQRSAAGTPPSVVAERFGVVESVIESVEAACQSPTMLLIDDVHWADPASLDAIIGFARVASTHPLILVVANRPGAPGSPMHHFMSELDGLGCRHVHVGPLAPNEVDRLLDELCGASASASLRRRVAGANGNPFLLRQYVDGLLAEGRLVVTDDEAYAPEPGIPAQLRAAVAVELTRLGDDVSSVLRAAAVQGDVIDVSDLAALLDRGPATLAGPIQTAVEAGFLADDGPTLRFRHDLVRIATYEQMPVALRAAIHRQLADVLTRRGAPSAVIGSHLVLSDRGDDPDAIELLQRAAADVAPVDPESALEFLDRARELASGGSQSRRVIERARMEALTGAGRLDEAEAAARWLLSVSPPELRAELWARLAGLAFVEGDNTTALEHLQQARGSALSDEERSPILALASITSAVAGDFATAWELAEEAHEIGERTGEPVGNSVGLAMTARLSTYSNSIDEGLRRGAIAVAIADADPTGAAHDYVPSLHYGMTAFDADRLDIADRMVEHGLDVATTFGSAWTRPLFGALAAASHYRRGVLDQALAEAETAVDLAERTSSRQAIVWAHSCAALAAVELGDTAQALRSATAAQTAFDAGQGTLGIDHLALAVARAARADGDDDRAYEGLAAAWDLFSEIGLTFCQPLIAADLGRLAHDRGDVDRLGVVSDATVSAGETSGVRAIAATGALLGALAANDPDRARRGLDRLSGTVRVLEVADWLAATPALFGDPVESLAAAHDIAQRCGATRRTAELAARLPTNVGIEPLATSGWDALTPTEIEIVQLLASGRTNAQIAMERGGSRRTVESHLGRVYQKLGIAGRVALTVAATEHFRA